MEGDVLIAKEKAERLKSEGILIDDDTPYSHASTYGGRFHAFIPKHIRSNNVWVGLIIFLVMLVVIELLSRFF